MVVIFYSNMFPSYGQQTIEVAKSFSVRLYFEEPIKKHDIENAGASCFQVKKDNEMSIITLTVNPDSKVREHRTNITIIADTGNIYSYILQVVKKPSKLNLKMKKENAVFNFKKSDKKISENRNIEPTYKIYENKRTKEEYYERKVFSHMHNMLQNPIFYRFKRKNIKGCLFLNDIKCTKNRLFIFLKLESRDVLDFGMKNVRAYIAPKKIRGNVSKKSEIEPFYYYKLPKRVVEAVRVQHFAIVFKKFTIENSGTLTLNINGLSGNGDFQLTIDGKEMNAAKRF